MRYLLVLLILSPVLFAQNLRPDQVRGTAGVMDPSGDQTVQQPAGTTFSVNSLNTVLNASLFAGSDIGAQVNAAIAALPSRNGTDHCGTIIIPAKSTAYSFSTTINLHRCDVLKGASGRSTELSFTGTSGIAILVSDADGTSIYARGHIDDIVLTGPATGTAVGVYFGGDPNCTAGCHTNPSTNFGDNFSIYNSKIQFFDIGIGWGNHAFLESFFSTTIGNNRVGLFYPSNLSDSGEAISFYGSSVVNSTNQGINIAGYSDFYFYGLGCDYNVGGCALVNGPQVHFIGTHFEQGGGAFIAIQSSTDPRFLVSVQDSSFVASGSSGADTAAITVADPSSVSLSVNHSLLLFEHVYTNFLQWNPSTFQPLGAYSVDLTGNTNLYGNSNITNPMSTPCVNGAGFFANCIAKKSVYSATASLASVAANTCTNQDLVMPGYRLGDIPVSLTKATIQPGLIISGIQPSSANDHPGITFCNVTASPITPTASDLYTLVIQR